MKIGLVCPYSITKGGGVQEIIFAMQAELARRGHDAYIITPQPRDLSPETAIAKHIIFVGTGTHMSSPIHTTGQVSAGLNEEIERMLDEYNFDILHFHEPGVPMLSRQILARSKAVKISRSLSSCAATDGGARSRLRFAGVAMEGTAKAKSSEVSMRTG